MSTTPCNKPQETTTDSAPPTPDELDRVITTTEKSLEAWRGNPGYSRTLTVTLYCLKAQRRNYGSYKRCDCSVGMHRLDCPNR